MRSANELWRTLGELENDLANGLRGEVAALGLFDGCRLAVVVAGCSDTDDSFFDAPPFSIQQLKFVLNTLIRKS